MIARQTTSLSSMQGCGGCSSVATKASIRGECGDDGWLPCDGKMTLYRWFSSRVVPSLASFVGSRLLGWVKISVGQVI